VPGTQEVPAYTIYIIDISEQSRKISCLQEGTWHYFNDDNLELTKYRAALPGLSLVQR
jgi:hypothetical protein